MSNCPNCNNLLDSHLDIHDPKARPEPNDITVCIYCGHICAFDDNLKLRELNDEEIRNVAGDPDLLELVEFGKTFRKYKKEMEENGQL